MPDRAMSDQITSLFEDRMNSLGQMLADGEINLMQFQVTMRQELRDAHALQIVAAADGDKSKVLANDWLILGSELQEQYRYLENFSHQIADGSVSGGAIANRASMYAGSSKSSYWKHATKGVDLPAYPGDGSSECKGHCGCEWVDNGDGSWSWVRGKTDSCATCIDREDKWANYVPETEPEPEAEAA